MSHWVINSLTYINPDSTNYSELLADDWYPTASLELGLRFLPEGLVVVGPATMRVSVYCGINWFPEELEGNAEAPTEEDVPQPEEKKGFSIEYSRDAEPETDDEPEVSTPSEEEMQSYVKEQRNN